METNTPSEPRRGFCSSCGAKLDPGGRFCHMCGAPAAGNAGGSTGVGGNIGRGGVPSILIWGIPAIAVIAVVVLVALQYGSRGADATTGASALGGGMNSPLGRAPDISAMSPAERADRLFNRVMRLVSEGKSDSAALFGPMAIGAFDALAPLNAHLRYDLGLVALVTGETAMATAQADSMLRERPTHLLGLALAARAAEARGDLSSAAAFRRRIVAAEAAELKVGLAEYTDHKADVDAALVAAKK